MTNVVFLEDHGVRRPGAALHPALALAHQAAEGLSDRIDCDAARAAFEAVLRDGPDIPERAVRGEADEGPDFGFPNGRGEVTMPNMRSPVQQAPGR